MKKASLLSDSEKEIMDVVWEMGGKFTAADLIARLSLTKAWKPTTIFTFLSRMVEKGVLTVTREDKTNMYAPRLSPTEYKGLEARSFLSKAYGGSFRDFVAALYESKNLTEQDITELKDWFKKL